MWRGGGLAPIPAVLGWDAVYKHPGQVTMANHKQIIGTHIHLSTGLSPLKSIKSDKIFHLLYSKSTTFWLNNFIIANKITQNIMFILLKLQLHALKLYQII